MSAPSTIYGIVARDLQRSSRQTSRVLGGLARPFMWLLLVGTGYNAIARVESGLPYQAFVFPGIVIMAALFGGMLTAIATVYDREFGMLRLMLASPAGVPVLLAGRTLAAALVGMLQGGVVLAFAPLVTSVSISNLGAALGVLALAALSSGVLGLLIASRLRSVENFAGVINVVLFPLLFLSGALYPTEGMPAILRWIAMANPVTYQVDLMRHAFGQPAEFTLGGDLAVLSASTLIVFALAAVLFDPEQRFVGAGKRN
jgi:ABC-2 type transport system permease protein